MGHHSLQPQREREVVETARTSVWGRWFQRLTGQVPCDPVLAERRLNERRSHSFWSFTYGSFRPRRRQGRRDGDHERVFLDWNDTWLSPAFRDWNIEEYLPQIRCPVLAIQGADDEYATMRQIEVIAEQVADTTLLKLPECGHSPHRDQPAAVLGAVDAFVRRLSGS